MPRPKERRPEPLDTIGGRITLAIEMLGLDTSKVARRLEVSPEAVRSWEKNRTAPRRSQWPNVAQVLQQPLVWLLHGEGGPLVREGFHIADRVTPYRVERRVLDKDSPPAQTPQHRGRAALVAEVADALADLVADKINERQQQDTKAKRKPRRT